MNRIAMAYVSVLVWTASVVIYAGNGFSTAVGLLWLAGLLLGGAALYEPIERPARIDLAAPPLLMLAFAPLYLIRIASLPVQVNSDEVAIMDWAKKYAAMPHPDMFGLSWYFGHPVALAVVWGKLGNVLGGVTLGHMRLLHALTGLLTIGLSYALFRQLLAVPWAVVASAVLGLNHAFLMISRMAMRENTPVLVEVVALALLLYGLRKRNRFATYCGGALAGLGYYVHFPGRMVFPVWLVFLVVLALACRRELGLGRIARLGAVATAAFALVALPYVVAYLQAPADLTHHQREALLLTRDGRVLQEHWVFANSIGEGIRKNIVNGLTAFNGHHVDESFIYPNWGHGIVDPLTGGLLWLGAATVLVRAIRRKAKPWNLFPLVAFLVLWLEFAFLVGQAPDYPRMLIALPFVAYLVTEGIRLLAGLAQRVPWPRLAPVAPVAVAVAALLAVGIWNGFIGWDFIHSGQFYGDDIGGTGRFIEAHNRIPGERFYVSANQSSLNYYAWGTPDIWKQRLQLFTRDDRQVGGVIDPTQLARFSLPPPFVIFMRGELWNRVRGDFERRYGHVGVHQITPDGLHLAVGVRRA
ncbi:MAG TPA: phospholipid carrier-dependent glycosyltransferase [Gaiellaceae bacterium]